MFGSSIECSNCQKKIPVNSKFCKYCGGKIGESSTPEIKENKWVARTDEFAAVIHIDDLEGFLSKNLVITPGTKVMFIKDGKFKGEVGPGNYTLDSILSQLMRLGSTKNITAVIVKDGELPLNMLLQGLPTKEFLEVSIECSMVANIKDLPLFMTNLIGTKKVFTIPELKQIIFPLLGQGLKEIIKGYSITDLSNDLTIRKKLDENLNSIFQEFLARYGLEFGNIQTLDFTHEAYDEHNRKKGTCWLQVEEEKAKLEQKKMLFEVYSEDELQNLKELERKNELDVLKQNLGVDKEEDEHAIRLRKIELQAKIRKAVNSDEFDKITNEEDMAKYLHEIDKDKLIRQEEKDVLLDEYNNRKEDRESARQHITAKLNMQREEEISLLRAEVDHKVQMKRFDLEMELARKVENEDNRRRIAQLEQEKREREFEYSKQYRDAQEKARVSVIGRDEKIRDAKTEAQLKDMEREQDQKDSELAMANLERIKKIKLEEKKGEQQLEIEKLKAMNELSPEVLVTMADAEQAKVIAQLQKTKSLKGLSAEQILAMSADNNPAVAEAFKEKFAQANAGVISDRERELYDKMLKQQESSTAAIQQTSEKAMEMVGGLAKKQAEALGARAAGTGGTQKAEQNKKVVICPSCRSENDTDARCCANCGSNL